MQLMCRAARRKKFVWRLLFFVVPFLYLLLTFPYRYHFKHSNVTSACVIPNLNPFDPSIMKFVWDPVPIVCDTSPVVLYSDESGVVRYNASALTIMNIDLKQIDCEYRILRRNTDDKSVYFEPPVSIKPPHKVNSDFFHLTCTDLRGNAIFDKLMTSVAKQLTKRSVPVQGESADQLSVFMFGLDSVSRSTSIRKLPRTIRFLTEELRAYDFKGYMKVW
ncbi:hypothetical protein DPMN_114498 [Dreissena polymorpha]|uniref:Uncharacterized protein n=1 Tax=Dreissena polymorpha TaxID=45954 RepID=A0A9D4KKA0_DREPO|nr:hypothetical protein DPMN_114498 [Dreissena polymorpha]